MFQLGKQQGAEMFWDQDLVFEKMQTALVVAWKLNMISSSVYVVKEVE